MLLRRHEHTLLRGNDISIIRVSLDARKYFYIYLKDSIVETSVENNIDTVISWVFYERSARMMDIAYVMAAVFDILTGFLRTCFSGDVHCLKKDSC